jgi:YidC/Oxa1 family membrane protein insertase
MDWKKSLNIAAIGFVAWLLIIEWSNFQDNVASQMPAQESAVTIPEFQAPAPESQSVNTLSAELPVLEQATEVVIETPVDARLVTVTTDAIEVTLDTLGGDIVQVKLLNHLTKMLEDGGEPFTLLTRTASNEYIAQSGLIGKNGTDTREGRGVYSASAISP